ncbi:hypothetical protein RE6C_04180 [Rhodopirellula europaea 6C]|uniref:Uncharacterized protein n=2 Tax=Rhodopirellula TaxID=265488 RepID=M2AZV7_9BACT|nr:hypothetical protein RE6C_04180 [Rhodopirellula europaea 6C]
METALLRALELLANQQAASQASNGVEAIEAMPERVYIELLAQRQNVAPFDASQPSPAGIWPQEQSVDDFLNFLADSRLDLFNGGSFANAPA